MKIIDSSIQLFSEHTSLEKHKRQESLLSWNNGSRAEMRENRSSITGRELKDALFKSTDRVEFSKLARKGRPRKAVAKPVTKDKQAQADLNIQILRAMIERLTGKVLDIRYPQDVAHGTAAEADATGSPEQLETSAGEGGGLVYDYYESHYEYESASFTGEGLIRTEDGGEINFSVQLNMTREFMSEQRVNIGAGAALKDPLVVNFQGAAAELGQRDFTFDIDLDGFEDQIAFTRSGGGFLALDKNDDGVINDGSELFGPATGDGFAELAEYDVDQNGWIDENDAVFANLRVWMHDVFGSPRLFSLGKRGIGAIYLQHIGTPFELKDGENELQGKVRDSSFFLNEDGTAGIIQQIDLAV